MQEPADSSTPVGASAPRGPGNFARRLLAEWQRLALPVRAAHMVVAVSGGADSTALLLACAELQHAGRLALTYTVAHLDHGLRGAAGQADAAWVAQLAQARGYAVQVERAAVPARAHATGDNLEQAARQVRYEFLARTARACAARYVLVGHTLDDQAETLLLALLRGGGAEGLGAMRPARALDKHAPAVELLRPLVRWARHADTVQYCHAQGVQVRHDLTNEDERFARVRVRRQLLPLLATFNPRVVAVLSRTAELLRADAAALEVEAARLLAAARAPLTSEQARALSATPPQPMNAVAAEVEALAAAQPELPLLPPTAAGNEPAPAPPDVGVGDVGVVDAAVADRDVVDRDMADRDSAEPAAWPLQVVVLRAAAEAVRRRALRLWLRRGRGDLRRLTRAHIAAVERLLDGEHGGRVTELPGGATVERRRGLLVFHRDRVEKGPGGL